jgi:hypothetical protein
VCAGRLGNPGRTHNNKAQGDTAARACLCLFLFA